MRINKLHIAWFVVTFFLGITVFELVRLVEHKIDSRVSTATIEPNTTVRDFSDESSVYQTILEDRFIEKRPVIILDSRFSRFSAEGQLEEFHKLESLTKTDGLEKATLEDFFNKNREALPGLRGDFTGYISLTREELQSIFTEYGMKGWAKVRERYPNSHGVLTLSRIGFNKEHTQAFVCVGFATDYDAGSGGYLLFQKAGNEWIMKEVGEVWVS